MSQIYFIRVNSTCIERSFHPTSIVKKHTYLNRHMSDTAHCLLVPASKQSAVSFWHMLVAVCTIFNSWWWTGRPAEACKVLLQKKLKHWCLWLVLLQKCITMHGPMNVKPSIKIIIISRPYIPDSHPNRITNTKCRIHAVVSPDDGHTVTRNM